ncbi:DUF4382 domain-containing protein [Thalassotalea ganghwensis]
MKKSSLKSLALSTLTVAVLSGCGGGSSNDSTNTPDLQPPSSSSDVSFNLGLSDAPVDDAEAVVVTIESITFKVEDGEDIVFETFSNESEGIVDAETITLDLLQFQGGAQFNVLEGATIEAGNYEQIFIDILDEDIVLTYLTEIGGENKPIKVPSDKLKLGGIDLSNVEGDQQLTVEFNLRKSLTYKPGPDEYNLKPSGVRVVNNSEAGTLSGSVDFDTINLNENCVADNQMIYVFEGHELNLLSLIDNVEVELANNGAPEGSISPFDSTTASFDENSASYRYEIGFLPEGDYTVAYACDAGAQGDDPEIYDGDILIPNPVSEIKEISIVNGEETEQNFPVTE